MFLTSGRMIPVRASVSIGGVQGFLPLLSFQSPWLLLVLPLLLLLPRRSGWWLRVLTLALLATALAGPVLRVQGGQLAVVLDSSESVGTAARAAVLEWSADSVPAGTDWFGFAADTVRLQSADSQLPAALERGETDIARALQVAAGSGASRILLVSDGIESSGSALQGLPAVPVDTLVLDPVDNMRLESLLLPEQAAPEQLVEGLAVVNTDVAATATLLVSVAGQSLPPVVQELPAGRSSIPFTFTATGDGSMSVSALVEVDYSQPLADDRLTGELPISEHQPILVIGDPAVAELLSASGALVTEGSPGDIQAPLNWSAIVVRSAANEFTSGQHELLFDYVSSGGGLMMTGGPDSFGFGGWFRTPVETALPVSTDLRTEVEIPLVAMVMIVDTSQSMSAGNPNRLELAKEGAIAVVDLAFEQDLLGLLSFSDTHSWAFQLRPATERGKREMLAAILGLSTQGGTILGPAYDEAITVLESEPAAIKHIIVLSDGRLYDGRGPFSTNAADFSELARRGEQAGITTSTIAIGADADFQQLQAIAEAGDGRYYEALDVTTLPRIFTSEALVATRSLLREETFSPEANTHMLSSMQGPQPPVDAYVATTSRPAAEVLLTGLEDEPVFSVMRHGLGRSAALTTDLNAWAPALAADDEFSSSLLRVLRWLQLRPGSYDTTVTAEGGQLHVTVDAVEAGEYLNNRNLLARFGGNLTELNQVGPGRYEGVLPAGGQGTLLVTDGDEIVARQAISRAGAEFSRGTGDALLAQLSSRSGGDVLSGLESYEPDLGTRGSPVWHWPLLAAFLLFLAELALRRFAPAARRTPTAGSGLAGLFKRG